MAPLLDRTSLPPCWGPEGPRSGVRLVDTTGPSICYGDVVTSPPLPSDPLKALAESARTGDPTAVRHLLEAVGPSMLGVVRALLGSGDRDVEDVLQESLVGVIQGLSSFRGESSFLHFARSIALRRSLDQRRKRARRRPELLALPVETLEEEDAPGCEGQELASLQQSPASSALAARRREAFRELLADIRPEQAEAFAQRVLFGRSVEEIASESGAPVETVRSRLRLAKAALRARIKGDPVLLELSELNDDDAS